ncbi:jg15862 [Pararge aegeria aegeria]|uniref:Jg15862 protein n=1 Tax=Pararge aegeria aegeria TaxID=348720 RepID=A0A8S4RA89_9NEOP|nr:jg15862 [Pararge aegeria aegeria]
MWCRRQAAAAILPLLLAGWLTGESSEALTTFGKSNTDAPKNVQPTPPPGLVLKAARSDWSSMEALACPSFKTNAIIF